MLNWETGTPKKIQEEFEPGYDIDDFCEKSEWGNQSEPEIKYFKIKLISTADNIVYKIKWKND